MFRLTTTPPPPSIALSLLLPRKTAIDDRGDITHEGKEGLVLRTPKALVVLYAATLSPPDTTVALFGESF